MLKYFLKKKLHVFFQIIICKLSVLLFLDLESLLFFRDDSDIDALIIVHANKENPDFYLEYHGFLNVFHFN